MITHEFHLHSSQGLILQDPSRFKVLDAGRRWGKTFLALTALSIEGLQFPEARLWYVSPTFRQSKQIAWILLKKLLDGIDCKWNESELSVHINQTGSLIELKGSDNEDSLRGAGLGTKHHIGGLALLVDEFASIYDNWAVWHEVLRPMLSDNKSGALFISTPKGKDSFWELFMRGQRQENDWKSWQFPTIDNPYIDPEEVEEARKTMPARYFRQEYEASFEDFTGLIYPEFNETQHVITPHKLEPRLEHIGAIDTAITGVTGVLKATVNADGSLVVYSEYYEADKRVNEIIPEIKEDDITWYIDPAAIGQKVQRQGKIFTLFDEYVDNGIHPLCAEKNVEGGINRVGEALKSGKIKIFSSCTNLIWELERYHWSEEKETSKGMVKPMPFKKNDHLVDCLRYLVMSREVTSPEDKRVQPGMFSPAYDWPQYNGEVKEEKFV